MDSQTSVDRRLLPLKKFSYVTSQSLQSQGKSSWTHLTGGQLRAVFDFVPIRNRQGMILKQQVLEILRDGIVLEKIFLNDLAHQARLDEEKSQKEPLPDAMRTLLIVVKKPLLAIRYQLPSTEIRRIQMNFLTEESYGIASRIITDHGLPVQDRNNESQENSSSQRHIPSQADLSGSTTQAPKSALHSQLISGQYPVSHSSNGPMSYQRTGEAIQSQFHATRPWVQEQALQNNTHYAPTLYRSGPVSGDQVEQESMRHTGLKLQSDPLPFHDYGNSQTLGLDNTVPYPTTLGVSGLHYQRNALPQAHSNTGPLASSQTQSQAARSYFPSSDYDAFTDVLPPKRDLPFGSKDRDKSTLNEQTNVIDDVEPGPSPINDEGKRKLQPKKAPAARSRKGISKQNVRPSTGKKVGSTTTSKDTACEPMSDVLETVQSSTADTTRASTVPSPKKPARKPAAKRKQPAKYTSTSMQTSPSPERLTAPAGSHKPADDAPRPESRPEVPVADEWQAAVEAFVTRYKDPPPEDIPNPAAEPVTDLAEYASRPVDERREAIDGMIMELIMDPNFETLCTDVESAWKRIGLGM